MPNSSNTKGRAYEYAVIQSLKDKVTGKVEPKIIENSSLQANARAWNSLEPEDQKIYIVSSNAAMDTLIDFEPLLENDAFLGNLILAFQNDTQGIKGDVRDIVITREKLDWEIGLSVKHNHSAIKHSRLAKDLDFGKNWYDISCSDEYWKKVEPIFTFLEVETQKGTCWRDLESKEEQVYIPVLSAFVEEIERANKKDASFIERLFAYLFGLKDYYKIISKDSDKVTLIESFNMNATLNRDATEKKAALVTPQIVIPSELIAIRLRKGSKTTVDMYMDGGWQFSFRLHNASTKVEPSLKFDINFQGLPPEVMTYKISWNKSGKEI